ncbi:pirin family protein [Streptomyces sp. AS58]|uniref:pirin family protein n=1 Tax=Streptomyces sp. AS58 TaxID=1519489 RepID=UPI0006AEF1D0|nr:pirin family protein [Streptomyces sp. AS58]KOV74793.1 pirin family protein [Streptomyces sp. AS58]
MGAPLVSHGRTVARVESKLMLGPSEQSDDRAMIFTPQDPALTDPFLVLGEEWFSTPGFEWHPHRGIETVTTVFGGVLEHGDSAGNAGALQPGDVQWMTAGRGIIHRELAYRDEHAHIMQLWINLPADRKLTRNRYQDLIASSRPRVVLPGVELDIVSGTVEGVTGPALNHVAVQAVMMSLEPSTTFAYKLPAEHRAFVHVVSGRVAASGRNLVTGQTAWSDPVSDTEGDSALSFVTPSGDGKTRLMIYSGTPIGEPVAFGGPFVMNHRSEIRQAFADFHAGKFGEVPRRARLAYDR